MILATGSDFKNRLMGGFLDLTPLSLFKNMLLIIFVVFYPCVCLKKVAIGHA